MGKGTRGKPKGDAKIDVRAAERPVPVLLGKKQRPEPKHAKPKGD